MTLAETSDSDFIPATGWTNDQSDHVIHSLTIFTLNYIQFRLTPASDPFVIRWMDCALRPQLPLFQEGTGDGQTEEFSRDAQAMAVAALLPRPIMYSHPSRPSQLVGKAIGNQ